MLFYAAFFSAQLFIIIIARLLGFKNRIHLITALAFFSSLVAGLRGNTGTDTPAYRSYYTNFDLDFESSIFEPTFYAISAIGRAINFDSQFLLLSVALLQGLAISLTARLIKERDHYYIIVLSSYFVLFNLNLIRSGLAIYILGFAILLLTRTNLSFARASLATAIMTHASSGVAIFLFWRKWYLLIPAIFIFLVLGKDILATKLQSYFLQGSLTTAEFSIGVGFFATNLLLATILFKEHLFKNRLLTLLFFSALSIKTVGFSIPIIDRVAIIFEYTFFVLLLQNIRLQSSRWIIMTIAIYNTYRSLAFISSSDEAMRELLLRLPGMADIYGDAQWIPFRFFWE